MWSKIIKSFGQYIDYEDIKAENVQGNGFNKNGWKNCVKKF